jgi:pSer/pThr/pTyr-binding forkhead associated (FHA) protein
VARIIHRSGTGTREILFDGTLRVGRDPKQDIQIDDPRCSREHTCFYVTDEAGVRHYWVRDMGSRNGTHLNGRRIEAPAKLAHGDVVRAGGSEFVFEADPAPAAVAQTRARRPAGSWWGGLVRLLILLGVFAGGAWGARWAASQYLKSLFEPTP